MEIFLAKLLYLLRPMLNAELVDWGLFGFGFFELVAILLFVALAAAFSLSTLQKSHHPVSSVEVWVALLVVWITVSYVVHINISSFSAYAKFIIPLMTYVFLKRTLPDRSTHVRMVFLMLVGFLLPFIMSAIMTYQGEGIGQVVYWTGLVRYQGIYSQIHIMGHNAAFAIMATIVYVAFRVNQKEPLRWGEIIVLLAVFFIGIYLLFATQVRSAYIGLVVFLSITLFFFDKRILVLALALSIAFLAFSWSTVSMIFYDFIDPPDLGPDFAPMGSGRLTMWAWAFENWRQAPLLNQITGMGVNHWGVSPARRPMGTSLDGTIQAWPNPHNDWLFVFLSFGVVGVVFFVGLFGSILRAILRIRGAEKFSLLGLFVAVVVTNGMSNSYITEFTLFQMFSMVMVYVDLKSRTNLNMS
jgi:O-antigen ligase